MLEIGEIGEIGEISWRDGGQGFEDVERILNVKDLFNPKDPWSERDGGGERENGRGWGEAARQWGTGVWRRGRECGR